MNFDLFKRSLVALLLVATGLLIPAESTGSIKLFPALRVSNDVDFSAEIFQLDINFDDEFIFDSSRGAVEVTFVGADEVLYLNLVRDGIWLVENFPILSSNGVGIEQSIQVGFDLGIPDGVDVQQLDVAMSLSLLPYVDPPTNFEPVVVSSGNYSLKSGHLGVNLQVQPTAGMVMIGGTARKRTIVGPSIPNQNCGTNECVPAAVSNALMFLNDHYDMNIDPALITIAALKNNLGFTTDGCPLPNENDLNNTGWPKLKRDYLRAHNIRISTKVVGPKNINAVIKALKKGCVVEMNAGSHTALVTGVAKLRQPKKYTIEVAHDTEQNAVGGTKFESMKYDKSDASLEGCTYAKSVHSFVIECRR